MSSNYYPSQTSDIPTIAGALNPQNVDAEQVPMPTYESALAPAPQAPPDPMAALGQLQAGMVQGRQEQNPPFQSITMKADGTFKMEGSQSMLADVMGQLKDLNTMKSAAMARVAQLRQQEASGSPLIDALSQFAGNMAANDPTMPGWVRALGATNLAMGPQGIKRERMAEEQKAFQYGQAGATLAQQLMQDDRANRALDIQELNAYGNLQGKVLAQKKEYDTGLDAVTKDLEKIAEKRINLTEADISKRLSLRGINDPEQTKTLSEYYGKLKTAADAAEAESRKMRMDDAQTKANIAFALREALAKNNNERLIARGEYLANLRADTQLRVRKEVSEFNEGQKSLAPLRVLSTPDQTMLHDMATNLEYLKQLKAVVNDPKTSQYLGPLNLARISGEWSTLFRPDELQTVMTYYAHELPRVAKFTGAQSRAFTAAMVPVIKSLGGETSMTPSQMNNVIKIIEESTQQVQSGIAKGKPLAPFHLAPDLLGGVDSPVYKEWVKTHENALKQSPGNAAASAPDEAKAARSAPIGATVVIGGKSFKKTGANNFEPIAGGQ